MSSLAVVGAALVLITPSLVMVAWLPRSPRRWLVVAFSLTVPVVGPLLGLVAVRTRGTDQIGRDLARRSALWRPPTAEDITRSGGLPPLLDRLMSADADARLSALDTIARRPDRHSIGLLRWTVNNGEPDAVLDAALTLEEIELGWRRELDRAMAELDAAPGRKTALAAADLAAHGIASGLADPLMIGELARAARDGYDRAARIDPSHAPEVEVRRARLEVVVGEPMVALDPVDRLRASGGWSVELRALRDRAHVSLYRAPSIDRGLETIVVVE